MRSSLFREVIKQHNLSAKLSPVFTLSPDLDEICARVVDYIGTNYRVREEPLIKEMLTDGIAAWRAARKHGDPSVAFMKGLFSRAHGRGAIRCQMTDRSYPQRKSDIVSARATNWG